MARADTAPVEKKLPAICYTSAAKNILPLLEIPWRQPTIDPNAKAGFF
jgi:hypothetical protein